MALALALAQWNLDTGDRLPAAPGSPSARRVIPLTKRAAHPCYLAAMPSRRLLLSCLLLAACPPRTPPEPPPVDTANAGDGGSPAEVGPAVPDKDVAPLAPDDPDAPDEPGEVEPGDKPAKPGSTRGDKLADTLSTRASRGPSRKSPGSCDGGSRRRGETWKVDCNSCRCGDDGQSTCTELACNPGPVR